MSKKSTSSTDFSRTLQGWKDAIRQLVGIRGGKNNARKDRIDKAVDDALGKQKKMSGKKKKKKGIRDLK